MLSLRDENEIRYIADDRRVLDYRVTHFSFGIILVGTEELMPRERTELIVLISPVFAVYVAAIVRRFTAGDATFDESPTHPALRILSIGTALVFSFSIPLAVYFFTVGKIGNFPDLKMTLGIIETALGVYTGAVIDRLFGAVTHRANPTRKPTNRSAGSC